MSRVLDSIRKTMSSVSMEAVSFQKTDDAFRALTEVFRKLQEMGEDAWNAKNLNKCGFADVIKKYFGMKAEPRIWKTKQINAAVIPPLFNPDSIFYQRYGAGLKALEFVKKKRKDLFEVIQKHPYATVDREKGKVGGAFSEITVPFLLTKGILSPDYFEPEEIAAIQLHEIGHAFSYFETISRVLCTNLAIETAMEEVVGVKEKHMKIQILTDLKSKGYLSFYQNIEKIAELDNQEIYTLLISDNIVEHKFARNQSPIYNSTAFEQQADQFASRFGAGAWISKGLGKLYRLDVEFNGSVGYRIFIMYFFRFFTMLSWGMAFGIVAVVIWTLLYGYLDWLMFGMEEVHRTYDKRRDRFKRIRNEIIGYLKQYGDEDKALLGNLLKQVEEIDEEMRQVENDTYLPAWKFRILANLFYSADNARKREQIIEDLLNNELYLQGYKYKQLAEELKKKGKK